MSSTVETERVESSPPEVPFTEERPLGGYAVLMTTFAGLVGGFAAWAHSSGRRLPERIPATDLALVTVATHKLSRLVAKDRVTSTLRAPFTSLEDGAGAARAPERPRGTGLRRAVGELVTCPHCVGLWIAGLFSAALVVAPRPTRWCAATLTAAFGSDLLHIAYRRAAARG